MKNLQPSLTVMLVGVNALLLCALIATAYLHLRGNRRHQHDLKTVLGIVRHAGQTSAAPSETAYEEFVESTHRDIGDIRETIARLDVKLGQSQHQDVLRDEELDRRIGQEDGRILGIQKELDDFRARQSALEQSLQQLRAEIEQLAARDRLANSKAEPDHSEASSSPSAHAAHTVDATPVDDFKLPDSVLNELEEVMHSATAHQSSPTPAARPQAVRIKTNVPRRIPVAEQAVATPAHASAARSAVATAQAVAHKEKPSVEDPQFAFDPARIDDLFNAPLFIPGAANAGINVEELEIGDLNMETQAAGAENQGKQPLYDAERVFYQASPQTGIKPGWYFTLRGGKTHGPFASKEAGDRVLKEMIEQFIRAGDSGGR